MSRGGSADATKTARGIEVALHRTRFPNQTMSLARLRASFDHQVWPITRVLTAVLARTGYLRESAQALCFQRRLAWLPSTQSTPEIRPFPPPALPGFYGHMALSNSQTGRHPFRRRLEGEAISSLPH
jgi:hypothetical protein